MSGKSKGCVIGMFRRYGDRSGWRRIIQSEYTQSFIEKKEFTGYITLINMLKVTNPLWVQYGENKICVADDNYMWLQHFPIGKNYALTTMFDANGEIVQWYIDICYEIGIENNIPWMDDLILDIVVLPTGEIVQLDEEELEDALENAVISKVIYDLARDEAARITALIKEEQFTLLDLSKVHKELLQGNLQKVENEHA